jgi:hypothetical protein
VTAVSAHCSTPASLGRLWTPAVLHIPGTQASAVTGAVATCADASPLAVVAAAIDAEPDPARRAELDELALTLLLLGILDRQVALLRARMCRLTP